MHPRRRSSQPPWERRRDGRRHPIGRARRRWPRAYDGGHPSAPGEDSRYGEAYVADRRRRQPPQRRAQSLHRLRSTPVRDGLIGLAIAGVAAPVAINRYQQALRIDPSHEATAMQSPAAELAAEWEAMAHAANGEGDLVEMDREASIRQNMERHRDFNVSRALAEKIHDAAVVEDIDPDIAFGLVRAESSFRNTATSPVGAVGLTQLMPRTAAWMQPGVTTGELRNPETNLRVGMKYLRYLLDKYNGNEDLALLAYNRGPGTVDRALRRGANPDNGYASFVRGEKDHGHTLFTNR